MARTRSDIVRDARRVRPFWPIIMPPTGARSGGRCRESLARISAEERRKRPNTVGRSRCERARTRSASRQPFSTGARRGGEHYEAKYNVRRPLPSPKLPCASTSQQPLRQAAAFRKAAHSILPLGVRARGAVAEASFYALARLTRIRGRHRPFAAVGSTKHERSPWQRASV